MENKIERFGKIGIVSILYAAFYAFCLYKNASGITYPFFVAGTFCFYIYCMKRLEVPRKKDAVFYIAATVLLGISTCLTDSWIIIAMNKTGIFLLLIGFLLHHFYDDVSWGFTYYLGAIWKTIWGCISRLFQPFTDFADFLKSGEKEKSTKTRYVIMGLVIALPLTAIVLMLLSSADQVFYELFIEKTWTYIVNIQIFPTIFGIGWKLWLALLISYCAISFMSSHTITKEQEDKRTGEPMVAITFTSVLAVVYIAFCAVQIIYLFMRGSETIYSHAAREGFFQLLFVCAINLALVLICMAYFKESKVLKVVLTLISVCTYIMIASSTFRMILYIRYYYLTFLRIFVLWALLVIALLMTGVLIYIYKKNFPLFRYSMITVTVLYILLSFSRPDYVIAKVNMTHYSGKESNFFLNEAGYQDTSYLYYNLSADAAPVLLNEDIYLHVKERDTRSFYYYGYYADKCNWDSKNIGIRNFNLSRFLAKQYLKEIDYVW